MSLSLSSQGRSPQGRLRVRVDTGQERAELQKFPPNGARGPAKKENVCGSVSVCRPGA